MVQFILITALLLLVAVPFLLEALRNKSKLPSTPHATQLIRRISEEEVICEFLKSEFENEIYRDYQQSLKRLVMSPDLNNKEECDKRRALLFLRHRSLWKELPLDTEWYEGKLGKSALAKVRVFPRAHWLGIALGNLAIPRIVEQLHRWHNTGRNPFVIKIDTIRGRLLNEGSLPGSILLIGLNEIEPLTIIDGNHRLVAAVLEDKLDQVRFIYGLSPKMTQCCWYKTNLFTLSRYTRNLLKHLPRHPEAELERLFESS
jgi:hypothetical protein